MRRVFYLQVHGIRNTWNYGEHCMCASRHTWHSACPVLYPMMNWGRLLSAGAFPQTWEDPNYNDTAVGPYGVRSITLHRCTLTHLVLRCMYLSTGLRLWQTSNAALPATFLKLHDKVVCCLLPQGDNDPTDLIDLSSRTLQQGVYKGKVLGAYALIDVGELDWKVCSTKICKLVAQCNESWHLRLQGQGAGCTCAD